MWFITELKDFPVDEEIIVEESYFDYQSKIL